MINSFRKQTIIVISIYLLQGVASTEYRLLAERVLPSYTPYSATGTLSISVVPGRVSYTFGLRGPSVPVETACSSSLVSLHTAVNSITLGQCPAALNGGLNIVLAPGTTAMFQKAGMLSVDGRCKTLSAAANGYVRSDACSAMFIIPSETSSKESAENHLAVIVGSAVNQDGRSSSLTAPNGPAQQEVIRAALRMAGLSHLQVSGLQMHGTGTPLGDPIEMGAAAAALNRGQRVNPLVLMASKSWTGHSEAGAGMVGLVHAQASLAQVVALPLLHLSTLNPYVLGSMGTEKVWMVPRQSGPIPLNATFDRAATGSTAFAFQGTNAHTLMQSPDGVGASIVKPNSLWNNYRLWIAPLRHAALHAVVSTELGVNMHCRLLSDSLAYLWDHQVSGRPLFPGAGFFELSCAAGRVLTGSENELLVLRNATIPAPLVMPSRGIATTLHVHIDCFNGGVNLQSENGGAHLRGSITAVQTSVDENWQLNSVPSKAAAATTSLLLSSSRITLASSPASHVGIISGEDGASAKDVFMSPAAFDCCLQLGAVPAVGASVALKVPTGVGAVVIPGASSTVGLFGSSLEVKRTGSASELNYNVHSLDGAAACSVAGLLSKPLGGAAQSKTAAAAAVAEEDITVQYVATWLATRPEKSLVFGTESSDVNTVLPALQLASSTDAAITCCAATSFLQSVVADSAPNNLHLSTGSVLEGGRAAPSPLQKYKNVGAALLWGMMRSVPQEMPFIRTSAIDSDNFQADASPSKSSSSSTFLIGKSSGDAYGAASCSRIRVQSVLQRSHTSKHSMRSNKSTMSIGNVVITGGTGSLGSLTANWLGFATTASFSMILVGRSGRVADGASSQIAALLSADEVCVHLEMGDASSEEDSSRLFLKHGRVAAVLHSGGVLADNTLAKQLPSGIRAAFAPKSAAVGTSRHQLAAHPVVQEILFSSVASLLGSPGQANYSAANSLLDALAGAAHQAGSAATSVQWGAWAGAGMAANDRSTAVRVARLGMGMVQPDTGLNAMQSILFSSSPMSLMSAVPFLWPTFIPRLQQRDGGAVPPMFHPFIEEAQKISAAVPEIQFSKQMVFVSSILQQRSKGKRSRKSSNVAFSSTKSKAEIQQQILTEVAAVAQSILGKEVSSTEPLMAAGLDSLSSVEFKNSLESKLAVQLPSTLVFDYPSVNAIAELISSQQAAEPKQQSAATPSAAELAEKVLPQVAAVAHTILGAPVEASTPLMSAGLDSLSSVEFKNSLESNLGLQLPSTLVFDYPSVNAIAQHVGSILQKSQAAAGAAVPGEENQNADETQLMLSEIMQTVQSVLRVTLAPEDSFTAAGIDEAVAARFLRALGARLEVNLPTTLLETCPSPSLLAAYFCSTPVESAVSTISGAAFDNQESALLTVKTGLVVDLSAPVVATVSVVGMVYCLPGGVLAHGDPTPVDACTRITADHWDIEAQPGMPIRFGGLLDNVSSFDSVSLGISEKEAVLMDPQQRVVLECVAEALAQSPRAQTLTSCGVFVGVSSEDYAKLQVSFTGATAYTATGSHTSVLCGRVSYTFGLRGPSLTIDTACSATLACVHVGFNALLLGQCEASTASGVNLLLHPENIAILQKAGMLTNDGRCKTLSTTADGYVRSDTVGTLLLETGEIKASECLAIITGSAVNQDGRSSSLTAPNGPAQQEVVRTALRLAQLDPVQICALQMHGTGTSLGDPIEIGAASASLVENERKNGSLPLVLMASKSWTGHAEPGAGIAGLAHAQLALTTSRQLPILHLHHMNPLVAGVLGKNAGGWAVPRQLGALPSARAVGTSAFAFQGTNAHVIFQSVTSFVPEAPPMGPPKPESLPFIKHYCWLAPAAHRQVFLTSNQIHV